MILLLLVGGGAAYMTGLIGSASPSREASDGAAEDAASADQADNIATANPAPAPSSEPPAATGLQSDQIVEALTEIAKAQQAEKNRVAAGPSPTIEPPQAVEPASAPAAVDAERQAIGDAFEEASKAQEFGQDRCGTAAGRTGSADGCRQGRRTCRVAAVGYVGASSCRCAGTSPANRSWP